MQKWILKDRNRYFKKWTGIGPAMTDKIDEAELFYSKDAAMQSPAFRFSLTFFEPVEINEIN
jgi:hypothetical protein